MRLFSTRNAALKASLAQAVFSGLAPDGGLFLPRAWERLSPKLIADLLKNDFVTRSQRLAKIILANEFPGYVIEEMVSETLSFPVPLVRVKDNLHVLELFHGPTLAFKDFGAKFLAQIMRATLERDEIEVEEPITVLTATSGDTGAAVAAAFHGMEGIRVCILYPKGRISPLQEKLFCTLGGNIRTFAVSGTFDDCQHLVKGCFADASLRSTLRLTSANSINVARLFGQIFYYFEVAARCQTERLVVGVPSGNFGNLTAGVMAKALGAPIVGFVAATNANDTIPRYLESGVMEPRAVIPTLSNAMDVALPNNWERIETLLGHDRQQIREQMRSVSLNESETVNEILSLKKSGYLACPHTAVAVGALERVLQPGETGVALSTAHPAKFCEALEGIFHESLVLPPELARVQNADVLSEELPNALDALKSRLFDGASEVLQ